MKSFVMVCCALAPLAALASPAKPVFDLRHEQIYPVPAGRQRALLAIFVAPDCPICNSYAPEIERIRARYSRAGIKTALIYTGGGLSGIRQNARAYGHGGSIVADFNHSFSRALKAKVTPEAVVVLSGGTVAYRGRIDNRFVDFGKERGVVSSHDLRDSLDGLLSGKRVTLRETPAVGCYIPEKG